MGFVYKAVFVLMVYHICISQVDGFCNGSTCHNVSTQALCFQRYECVMSCASMNDGSYRSCTSCNKKVSCHEGQLQEQTCPEGQIYHELHGCTDDVNRYCVMVVKGVLSRTLCKTYLSDHQPLCKYASQVQRLSILELVLQNSTYYINNCTYNSTEYLETLNISHVLAIRQRPDLMFGQFMFEFEEIYTSQSSVRWEVGTTTGEENGEGTKSSQIAEGEDFTEYPRLFHLTYTCISSYTAQVISMQNNETVEGMDMVYIESKTGLFGNWSSGVHDMPQTDATLLNRTCIVKPGKFGAGSFYIGGPGTLFETASADIKPKIRIKATESEIEYYVYPGITNNLQRIEINTDPVEQSYTIQYTSDGYDDASVQFILPIGPLEQDVGTLKVECGHQDASVTSDTSTLSSSSISLAFTKKETTETTTAIKTSKTPTDKEIPSTSTKQGVVSMSAENSSQENQKQRDTGIFDSSGTTIAIAVGASVIVICVIAVIAVFCFLRRRTKSNDGNGATAIPHTNQIYNTEDVSQLTASEPINTEVHDNVTYAVPNKAGSYRTTKPREAVLQHDLIDNGIYNEDNIADKQDANVMVDNEVYQSSPLTEDTPNSSVHVQPPVDFEQNKSTDEGIFTKGMRSPENDRESNKDKVVDMQENDVYESGGVHSGHGHVETDGEVIRESSADMVDNGIHSD